jgi:hypothetical protein
MIYMQYKIPGNTYYIKLNGAADFALRSKSKAAVFSVGTCATSCWSVVGDGARLLI